MPGDSATTIPLGAGGTGPTFTRMEEERGFPGIKPNKIMLQK